MRFRVLQTDGAVTMLYAVLLLLTFCHGVLSSALEPGVSLANGQFIGVRNETSDLTIFYGIPFAAPPVGDLRWRAPEPPASNPNATFNATDNLRSAICPQAIVASIMTTNFSTSTETPYSEDCLSLTVYTPGMPDSDDGNPETPYAVVVYLHGGGYTLGDHSQNNPEAYLELVPQDVVAVVPNYRLGLFGFLAGNAVKENGVLNAGMKSMDPVPCLCAKLFTRPSRPAICSQMGSGQHPSLQWRSNSRHNLG